MKFINYNLNTLYLISSLSILGFNSMVWFRIGTYYNNIVTKYILFRKSIKFGIQIPLGTRIGAGFYIGHFGNIVVNGKTKIGKNCNILQGVTIGKKNGGKNEGYPILGDNCYIAPGAKIIGAIIIGNNVAIGANAVVTKNIPENSVAIGIPAKFINSNISKDYIQNKIEDIC